MAFYTYLYLREDNTPYYVGKGSGNRAFISSGHVTRPPRDRSRIVVFNLDSEQEAFETEKELIRNWGRRDIGTGILRNMTDGGEGASHSIETRAKLSVAMMGNKNGAESKRSLGSKHSEEFKAKRSITMVGNQRSLGKNLGNTNALGYRHTSEEITKLRTYKHTPEAKVKIAVASAAMWAARRVN